MPPVRRHFSLSRLAITNLLLLACSILPPPSTAQLPNVSTIATSNNAATPPPPTAVAGRVINAVTGLPIPRALVRLNNRSLLTDHSGKFDFEQVTDAAVNITATKPGFATSSDPADPPSQFFQLAQLTGPVELKLYPEAIITGTLTGPDGEPLAQVTVQARRSVYDESGHHWAGAGQGQTNSHGEFRIPVPAGDYRLESRYIPRSAGAAEAILPVSIPAPGASDGPQAIHLSSGEEQHFDLRPAIRHTYPVAISMDAPQDRGFPAITARASDGSIFNVGATPNRGPNGPERDHGQGSINLPTGTYVLTAKTQKQEGLETAEARVTVTGADDAGPVVLRLLATPSIPVEISVDSSATSDNTSGSASSSTAITPPTAQQFGLTLQRLDQTSADDITSVPLSSQRAGVVVFNAPPGTYRLLARVQNRWYIRSASFGATDLLREPITVAAGTSSAPIRLVVTNQTGSLQGTVNLAGQPAVCWVYLLPTTPSAALVTSLRSSASTGAISSPYLPPGTYQAIAFERRQSIDFANPAVLVRFSPYIQSVTITAGSASSLNLNAVPQSETEAKP